MSQTLPEGYSIHSFTIPDAETGEVDEIFEWHHVNGEVSGHVHGDRFVRDRFGSWAEAAADIAEHIKGGEI